MTEYNFVYVPIGITSFVIVVAKTSILLALLIPASLFLLPNQ